MKLLKNLWFKRGISLLCYIYAGFVLWLGIKSFFYDASVGNGVAFAFLFIGFGVITAALALYARKQVLTSILAMLLLLFAMPVLFFNIGCWWVVIPVLFVSLTIFFGCGATEGIKTVFGTIFLLGYILGALAFFIVTNVFITPTIDNTIETGVSPSGEYRYYILDTQDQLRGSTSVYVEPNNKDFDAFGIHFAATGFAQRKYYEQGHEKPTVEWRIYDGGEHLYVDGKRCDIAEFKWSLDPRAILL